MPRPIAGSAAWSGPGPALTIGNFDGVHLGHRALVDLVKSHAMRVGGPGVVFTFEPPPRQVLQPGIHPPRIQTLEDKVATLEGLGVEVVVERFDHTFARQDAAWFVEEILGRRLQPRVLVVGHDFRFGRGRAGDVALVGRLLPGLEVVQVAPVSVAGRVVSSSQVREAVAEGRVEDATALLGRPHSVRGVVVAGHRRGRTIGVPTANLRPITELLPARGVYATEVQLPDDDGSWLPAVTNLGVRPTFDDGEAPSLETHLLDWSGDLYDRELRVRFVRRIRGEQRFDGVDALVARIRRDVLEARAALGVEGPAA